MAAVTITVKRFDRLKEFPEISSRNFGQAMKVSTEKVIGDAIRNSPVGATGFFRSAYGSDIFIQASPFRVEGSVLNSAPYAGIIEGMDEAGNQTDYGRRPGTGFPNFGALRYWVVRVLGDKIRATVMVATKAARAAKQKVSKVQRESSEEEAIDQATWAIGRAIVRRGIKPKRPLGNAMTANRGFIQQVFDETAERTAKEIEGGSA